MTALRVLNVTKNNMKIGKAKKFTRPGIHTPRLDITTIITRGYQISEFQLCVNKRKHVFVVKNNNITAAWQALERKANTLLKSEKV